MVRQKRGTSLDLTLKESSELKNLGLTFEKWQVQSPCSSTLSSKTKRIILKRVDRDENGKITDGFDKKNESWQAKADSTLTRSILEKKM